MKSLFRKVILMAALIAASVSAMAQQVTASGVVKDTKGVPVIGASVIQTGTNNGVIPDIDGTFSLNVPEGAILTVSSIGYKTVNVAAASIHGNTLSKWSTNLTTMMTIAGQQDVTTTSHSHRMRLT